jgi:DNA-directed RNA polymerase specialized sigma24 family protein
LAALARTAAQAQPWPTSPPPTDDPLMAAYLERRANLVRVQPARTGSLAAPEDLARELHLRLAARDRAEPVIKAVALLYRMAFNLMLDRAGADPVIDSELLAAGRR